MATISDFGAVKRGCRVSLRIALLALFCAGSAAARAQAPLSNVTGRAGDLRPQPLAPVVAQAFSPKVLGQLPLAIQMHSTAFVGSRLYVMGGNAEKEGWLNNVWSAPVGPDFRLGQWRAEAPLPDRRSYIANATQVINNRIYIVGGTSAAQAETAEEETRQQQTVLYTTVRPDGTLDSWKVSEPFPGQPRSNAATASMQGLLFVTGGAQNRRPIDDVAVARIGPDGAPAEWRVVGRLPRPLWFHGVAIQQERMFVWGGLTGSGQDSSSAAVWSAGVTPTGELTPWREEVALPYTINSSAFCGFNDRLIAVCGRGPGGQVTQDIIMGQIQGGRVAGWKPLRTDLQAHLYHGLALDEARGSVFVVGGRRRTSPVNLFEGFIVTEARGFQMGGGNVAGRVTGALASMKPLEQGELPPAGAPAVIYFHSPQSPSSLRFESEVLATPAAQALLARFSVFRVDASKNSQLSYRYGLFKVPSMIRLDEMGRPAATMPGVRTLEDIQALLKE